MSAAPTRRTLLGLATATAATTLLPAHVATAKPNSRAAAFTWTSGTPTAPGPTVVRERLQQLPGTMSSPEIVVSNNPETVTGPGWLTQHARTTSTRGGTARALSGTFPLYLYHQNNTGRTAYLHVLVSNPGSGSVTVSARGSAWTNADKPLVQNPASRAGTGPCYAVSEDWLGGGSGVRSYLSSTSVASKSVVQAARLTMTGSILDARLEITASAGVYVYTVVTLDGSTTTARNYSQNDGQFAPGNIISQTDTTYGRQSGVYGGSRWRTGPVALDVPAAGQHLGLALNTTVRQVASLDQTVAATAALTDSSQRSWGNYGSEYDVELQLNNPSSSARSVRLTFGSNVTGSTDVPGNTWNGAMAVSTDGGAPQIQTVYVRPTVPRDEIGTYPIPANGRRTVRLRFFVPGLITAGSQLLLESV